MVNNQESKGGKSGGRRAIKLVCIILSLGVVGSGVYFWKDYTVKKQARLYREETEAFIEKRRFDEARKSLQLSSRVLPNQVELEPLEKKLKTTERLDELEKKTEKALQGRRWEQAALAVKELQGLSIKSNLIVEFQTRIKEGVRKDEVKKLSVALIDATKEDDLKRLIEVAEQLMEVAPNHTRISEWQATKEQAIATLKAREKEAQELYLKGVELDQGKYDHELLLLMQKALTLSDADNVNALFTKISAYPRDIQYPREYSSLQEAVDAARDIDSIFVKEGSHFSPITINKKVRIIGEFGKSVIIHNAKNLGPAVHVGPEGEFTGEHLMFKHTDSTKGEESGYSAVTVEGVATLKSCLFYNSGGHGVPFLNGGKGGLELCRFESNTWDGVAVSGKGSSLSLKDCITTKNRHHGVDVWDNGSIEMEGINSIGNLKSGLVFTNGGKGVVKTSLLKGNGHSGVHVTKQGAAEFVEVTLDGNTLAGAYGKDSGLVKFTYSEVIRNQVAGIVLEKGTNWEGIDKLIFKGNKGKKMWLNAEFEKNELDGVVFEKANSKPPSIVGPQAPPSGQ